MTLYYKMRQAFYYEMQQLLQNATFITKYVGKVRCMTYYVKPPLREERNHLTDTCLSQ